MRLGICAVSSALAAGDASDTNAVWLARRLVEAGFDVACHVSVGEDRDLLSAALRWLVERCQAVVVIGGLGPTHGNLTRVVVAEIADVPLERRDELVPAGAVAFEPIGTTPGFALAIDGAGATCAVYALPGTQFELQVMTERDVLPDLACRGAAAASEGRAPVRPGSDEVGVEQAVAQLLRDAQLTVATAESCTAGAVMIRLAAVPGASAYLRGGLVAYATEVKSTVLGLDKGLVDEHGPVSLQTTKAMARRAQELFEADLGVGVTCVAGPDTQGGRSAGTIVWALATRDGNEGSGELGISGDRPHVQRQAAAVVLEALRRHLLSSRPPGEGAA